MYKLYYSPGCCSLVIDSLLFVRMTSRPAIARAIEREGIEPFGT